MRLKRLCPDRETKCVGHYQLAWRRWVCVILLCAIVPALVGLAATIGRPKTHVAKAELLAEVTAGSSDVWSSARSTLESLVQSSTVAEQVFQRHAGRLAPEITTAEALLAHVTGTLSDESDLVEISVSTQDAGLSVVIANDWATSYEHLVNAWYTDDDTQSEASLLEAALEGSQDTYDAAEHVYLGFLVDNRIAELESAISQKEMIIEGLLKMQSDARLAELRRLLDDQLQLERILADALALREVVEQDALASGEVGAMLAMLNVAARVPSVACSVDMSVESSAPGLETEDVQPLSQQVERLCDDLAARTGRLDGDIAASAAELAAGSGEGDYDTLLETLRSEALVLEGELERERSRLTELREERDLAAENRLALSRQKAQLDSAVGQRSARVQIVNPAVAALPAQAPGPLQATGVAGMAGLMLGLGIAFVVEYVRWETRRARETSKLAGPDAGGSSEAG